MEDGTRGDIGQVIQPTFNVEDLRWGKLDGLLKHCEAPEEPMCNVRFAFDSHFSYPRH